MSTVNRVGGDYPPGIFFTIRDTKYMMRLKERKIEIVDPHREVIASTSQKGDYHKGRSTTLGDAHYFIFESKRSERCNYVYSFNQTTHKLTCILSPLQDPHFVGDRVVEFGSGCNEEPPYGPTFGAAYGGIKAAIRIFDLTLPQGHKEVKHHVIESPAGPWKCWIDPQEKMIHATNKATSQVFPIFE